MQDLIENVAVIHELDCLGKSREPSAGRRINTADAFGKDFTYVTELAPLGRFFSAAMNDEETRGCGQRTVLDLEASKIVGDGQRPAVMASHAGANVIAIEDGIKMREGEPLRVGSGR